MGLFQALLLAASLGWTSVLAEPSSPHHRTLLPALSANLTSRLRLSAEHNHLPSRPGSNVQNSSAPHNVHRALSQRSALPALGHNDVFSSVTMQSATSLSDNVYASLVSMVTGNSLDAPGSRPGQYQQLPTARLDRQHHSPGEELPGSTWQSGTSGPPLVSAVVGETYYVHGQPVVAGASPTVIAGTTYSVGRSGGRVWVDGMSTSVVGVVSTPVALATSSYAPAAATGGGMALAVPRMLLGIVCGIVAAL